MLCLMLCEKQNASHDDWQGISEISGHVFEIVFTFTFYHSILNRHLPENIINKLT